MKHIEKILPLWILIIIFLFTAINISQDFFVIVYNYVLNSSATVIGLAIFSIIILLTIVVLSLTKKIKFKKRYAVFAILSSVLILSISDTNVEFYTINSTKKCNGKQYYLISNRPNFDRGSANLLSSSDIILASSDNGIFLKKIDLVSIPYIFPSSDSLDYIRTSLTNDNKELKELVKEIRACPM